MTEQNYGETLTHKLAVPAGLELDNFSGRIAVPAVPEYRGIRSRLAWGQRGDSGQRVHWQVAVLCTVTFACLNLLAKLALS